MTKHHSLAHTTNNATDHRDPSSSGTLKSNMYAG